MSSNINTAFINGNYPTALHNNDSQGFRNNFTAIKDNLDTAGIEISALQAHDRQLDQSIVSVNQRIDGLTSFSGNYNDLTNKPTIPQTLTELGIAAGTTDQVLAVNSDGSVSFRTIQTGGGTQYDQSLNTFDNVKFASVETTMVKTGGAPINFDIAGTADQWLLEYKNIDNINNSNYANSVAYDSLGNLCIIGGSDNNSTIDLVKISPTGQVLWRKLLGEGWVPTSPGVNGQRNDTGEDIICDSSNNIYCLVNLYYWDNLNNSDIYGFNLLKFDATGTLLWQTTFGQVIGQQEQGISIALDPDENIVLVASIYNAITNENGGSVNSMAVLKINQNGNLMWQKRLSIPQQGVWDQFNESRGIVTDTQGNMYFTGAPILTDPYGSTYLESTIITKLASDGSKIWSKEYYDIDLPNGIVYGQSPIAMSKNNDLYVSISVSTSPNNEDNEIMIMKISPVDGSIIWKTTLSELDRWNGGMATDDAGNVYVSGTAYNQTDQTLDHLTIKLSTTGEVVWSRLAGRNDSNEQTWYGMSPDCLDVKNGVYAIVGDTLLLTGGRSESTVYQFSATTPPVGTFGPYFVSNYNVTAVSKYTPQVKDSNVEISWFSTAEADLILPQGQLNLPESQSFIQTNDFYTISGHRAWQLTKEGGIKFPDNTVQYTAADIQPLIDRITVLENKLKGMGI